MEVSHPMMLRPVPHRVLATIALSATLGLVLLFAAHSATPHQRCPFVPGQCQTQTAEMFDRHVDALRSVATATFDGGAASVALVATLLPFAFAPLVVPQVLAIRPSFSWEHPSERFREWLALLERRDPLARLHAA